MSEAKRVLVMEDNIRLARLYCAALENAGFETLEANSFQQAGKLMSMWPCEIFVCDMHIGRVPSSAFLDEVKRLYPAVKVVLITEEAEQGRETPNETYLQKPVILFQLVTLVQSLADRDSVRDR